MKKLLLYKILFLFCLSANAQTANVDQGCVPLKVDFTGGSQPSYFWMFGNGSTSTLENPEFIYTSAGTYIVELFQGQGGPKVGEILVTVFEDPILTLSASDILGCSPVEIDFTSNITLDPAISITSYLWSFGDGASSVLENPKHTYSNPGVYNVSLEVQTNFPECNQTIVENQLISIDGVAASFNIVGGMECEAPAIIIITNTTEDVVGNTYQWDFGNGSSSTDFNPSPVTYGEPGTYVVTLTVETPDGCIASQSSNIVIGNPAFDLTITDTICFQTLINLPNNTIADSCRWNYTGGVESTSSSKNLIAFFIESGLQTISLSCFLGNCVSDTSFTIFVEDVNSNFIVDPVISCSDTVTVQFIADDLNYQNYTYTFKNENFYDAISSLEIICPPAVDSIYENKPDTTFVYLEVISSSGCMNRDTAIQVFHKPTARIMVDVFEGCAPLTVQFNELLDEVENATTREWFFDDGSPSVTTDLDSVFHTFTEPGEYFVKVQTEDIKGCRDTSNGVWIYVGEFIDPLYQLDKTEICLGDTINVEFLNDDPRIDALVFETDGLRYNDCWIDKTSSHTFITEPGVFDASFVVEYNGCYNTITEADLITVNGAKANISYMINCDTPNDVMVTNESLNATAFNWKLDNNSIQGGDQFTQNITDAGVYHLFLEASNTVDNCPVSVDSVELNITNLSVDLILPDTICYNEEYNLDASASTGVDDDCNAGYLWNVPGSRPRQNNKDTINHFFPPGIHEVSLIVEDINGCTLSTSEIIEVHYIEANFDTPFEELCGPTPIDFINQSLSDNPIVSYEWSFGSNEENPTIEFPEFTEDSVNVGLVVVDNLGCMDTLIQNYDTYQPVANIVLGSIPRICVGEELLLAATNYTENGSFLNYEWDLGILGDTTSQAVSVQFSESGSYPVELFYYEDSTGCSGSEELIITVVDNPVANFTGMVDGEIFNFDEELCHPKIIEFINTSQLDGPSVNFWTFDTQTIQLENPSYSFERGTHDIQLLVASIYGCSDTLTAEVTLVGPTGDLIAEATEVCYGDELDFSVTNLEDVNSIEWNLGGGAVANEVEDVAIIFDQIPEDSIFTVDVILKSSETGCEYIESVDILVIQVIADFVDSLVIDLCGGIASFEEISIGASNYQWDFGNGQTSDQQNPEPIRFQEAGIYTVTLQVSDENSICLNEYSSEIPVELSEIEDVKVPNVFSPNGDSINDEFNIILPDGLEDQLNITEFKIYNRWGKIVYDNDSPTQGWNGTYDGEIAPAEVYSYYIEVEIAECGSFIKKGNLTIVR